MIGILLTEGTHTVSFRYQNKAFDLGWKISLGSALVFVAITVPIYRSRKEKGRFLK